MARHWTPPGEVAEYKLLRRLGHGAMGQVWLAEDRLLERPAAVKFPTLLEGPRGVEARLRFLLEGKALARLRHPNLIAVYHAGEIENHPYLVTELLNGQSLDQLGYPLAAGEVLRIARYLARGLAAAHRAGILHRDLKPANVFRSSDGTVKLLDFGLAKLTADPTEALLDSLGASRSEEDGGGPTQIDATSMAPRRLLGTPFYLAPELWEHQAASRRSDLYSLGAMLHHLLVGHPPHPATTLEELRSWVRTRPIQSVKERQADAAPGLCRAIDWTLEQDARARPQSAEELFELLEDHVPPKTGDKSRRPSGSAPRTSPAEPYAGLLPFDRARAALFFGRESEVESVLEQLRVLPVVAVLGSSGEGKSSLIAAGVLPRIEAGALEDTSWRVVRLVPGSRPFDALALAAAPLFSAHSHASLAMPEPAAGAWRDAFERLASNGPILLVIDQLEESLGASSERAEWWELLEALIELQPNLRMLIGMRSDALGRLEGTGRLRSELLRGAVVIGPLRGQALRRAIVEPCERFGYRFESDALVDHIAAAAGTLPILEFALLRLWEARDEKARLLSSKALEGMGGIKGAVARHADRVLEELPASSGAEAKRLLVELVDERGARVRRAEEDLLAAARELAPGGGERTEDRSTASTAERLRSVLPALVAGRIVVARDGERGPEYELAHDVLLESWPRLIGWIEEEAAVRSIRARLSNATGEWERLGRRDEALFTERQLAELDSVGGLEGQRIDPRRAEFVRASRRAVRRQAIARWRTRLGVPIAVAAALAASTTVYVGERTAERTAFVAQQLVYAKRSLKFAAAAEENARAAERAGFLRLEDGDAAEAERRFAERGDLERKAGEDFAAASEALDRARGRDPSEPKARGMAALLSYRWLLYAERHRLKELAQELSSRLLTAGDDRLAARLAAPGTLTVVPMKKDAQLVLRLVSAEPTTGRFLASAPRALLAGRPESLPAGSYVVEARVLGQEPVVLPVLIARSATIALELELSDPGRVPPGYTFVPRGPSLFGSPDAEPVRRALGALPEHEATTPSFLIAKHESTFGEYMAFLEALPAAERAERRPRGIDVDLDLGALDGPALTLLGTRASRGEPWCRPSRADPRRKCQDWRRLPVVGVSFEDAGRFARWLSESGRIPGARLCASQEWERAARGADGRTYPFGDRLSPGDANVEETYDRDPNQMGPDEVGSHAADTSPFGIRDMAGNVFEWVVAVTKSGPPSPVVRGGAWDSPADIARSAAQGPAPDQRYVSVGIRICASSHSD